MMKRHIHFDKFYVVGVALELYDYTNIDWASRIINRWSTSGSMLSLGSVAINWSIKATHC